MWKKKTTQAPRSDEKYERENPQSQVASHLMLNPDKSSASIKHLLQKHHRLLQYPPA